MSGRKNFRILQKRLEERLAADPEARFRYEEQRRALEDALALAELREGEGKTQAELARILEVSQSNVSQVEHKDDLYVSTLREYVEALGGRLEIRVVFPDRIVNLAVPAAERQDHNERAEEVQ